MEVSVQVVSIVEPVQSILAAARTDSEESFWMIFLIIAIAAAVALLWFSSRKKSLPSQQDSAPDNTGSLVTDNRKWKWHITSLPGPSEQTASASPALDNSASSSIPVVTIPAHTSRRKTSPQNIDRQSGIELLDLDFLCRNVKNIDLKDKTSVSIRKFCFEELARRNSLNYLDGSTLKAYAKNEDKLFDKAIQCQALSALASKTSHQAETSRHSALACP